MTVPGELRETIAGDPYCERLGIDLVEYEVVVRVADPGAVDDGGDHGDTPDHGDDGERVATFRGRVYRPG